MTFEKVFRLAHEASEHGALFVAGLDRLRVEAPDGQVGPVMAMLHTLRTRCPDVVAEAEKRLADLTDGERVSILDVSDCLAACAASRVFRETQAASDVAGVVWSGEAAGS